MSEEEGVHTPSPATFLQRTPPVGGDGSPENLPPTGSRAGISSTSACSGLAAAGRAASCATEEEPADTFETISFAEIKATPPPCVPVTLEFRNVAVTVAVKRGQGGASSLQEPPTPLATESPSSPPSSSSPSSPSSSSPSAPPATSAKRATRFSNFGRAKNLRRLLDGVSGKVEPGQLVAVMGASGAGKSTLLRVLSGRSAAFSGQVFANDVPLGESSASDSTFKRRSCFILQEDLFLGYLTVKEHLSFMMDLKLGRLEKKEKEKKIERILKLFTLEKVSNSLIGNLAMGSTRGISGGEKKRLAIAADLLPNPSLLFADEPTSGLDAFMAESVMKILRLLADHGRTVVCTIHQPSSSVFGMFSKVLLLSEGAIVYFGPAKGVLPYFSKLGVECPPFTNPADFLIDALATPHHDIHEIPHKQQKNQQQKQQKEKIQEAKNQHPDIPDAHNYDTEQLSGLTHQQQVLLKMKQLEEWREAWKQNGVQFNNEWRGRSFAYRRSISVTSQAAPEVLKEGDEVLEAKHGTNRFFEISVLLRRAVLCNRRNPMLLAVRVVQTVVAALMAGLLYLRLAPDNVLSKNGVAFFMTLNQGVFGIVGVLQTFTQEKPLALREQQAAAYRLSSYFLAKTFADLLFQIFNPIIFAAIVWYMSGVNDIFTRFLTGALFIFLGTHSAISVGYFISSVTPNYPAAISIFPVFVLPTLLASGFIIILSELPAFWIWLVYLSPFRWCWSGVMHAIWRDAVIQDCSIAPSGSICFPTGEALLKYYAIDGDEYWKSALALCVQIVVFRFLSLGAFLLLNGGRVRKRGLAFSSVTGWCRGTKAKAEESQAA
eukprot:GHVT01015683.1.p1 GENE.GHVT01015683.1~~GHVT01015683.1.p1  ORF type:complete len:829 (-),score=174.20 GHVT01015683.1:844-3330(-)